MRVLRGSDPCVPADRPLIVYLNHPSWWDPLTALVAATHYFPDRQHHAPIEAVQLARYPFFRKLGFFGLEADSRRGAVRFLRTSLAILQQRDAALWVTAEGHFTDVRARPVRLEPGVAHLAARLPHATILPMAIEYPFWRERYPEALLAFGNPLRLAAAPDDPHALNHTLEQALERTMDHLAAAAAAGDPGAFAPLLSGGSGVGGAYDLLRRMRAWFRGRAFDPSHGREDRSE